MATAKKTTKKKKTTAKRPAKKTTTRKPSARTKRARATKDVMHIRGNLRLKYATAFAEYSAAESELKAANAQLMVLQNDPAFAEVFKAINAIEVANANKDKKHSKVCSVAREVADKIGVTYEEFGNLNVNTETGTITPTPAAST